MAQLAVRFNWTWIGAVIADNTYGLMAMKVFPICHTDCRKKVALRLVTVLYPDLIVHIRYSRRGSRAKVCVWPLLRSSGGRKL